MCSKFIYIPDNACGMVKKNQIIDAVEVLSCYANFLDNRYCAQTSNKKSVDTKWTKIMLYLENDKNIDFTCSRECFTFFPLPSRKKWQNICPKFRNGILTRSTRTIDSTFDVAVSDERSAKKIKCKNRRMLDTTRTGCTSNPLTYYRLIRPRSKSNYIDRIYRARAYVPYHFTTGRG